MKRVGLPKLMSLLAAACGLGIGPGQGQLLDELASLVKRVKVDAEAVEAKRGREGPKALVTDDFDGDGKADFATANLDGTVSVVYGKGGEDFEDPVFLETGGISLRGMVTSDLNGDGFSDFVVADPFQGNVKVLLSTGARTYAEVGTITQWVGVRALVTGDFNGDGLTDLAAAGPICSASPDAPGLRVLLGNGMGGFPESSDVGMINLTSSEETKVYPARPVHVMAAFRANDATRDSLVVGHENSQELFVYLDNGDAEFRMEAHYREIRVPKPIEIKIGDLSEDGSELNDLVVISKTQGQIRIYRDAPFSGVNPWAGISPQTIAVPGAPRSVEIADMNNDGLNDLVVVLRNFNRVIVFENNGRDFEAVSEIPTGSSPRAAATLEINGDDLPDLLVMNRSSQDVSVILSDEDAGGVGVAPQIYAVDGQVVQLEVVDLNGDGQDDVVQLHTASREVSVRLALEDGLLSEPTCYPTGVNPISFTVRDLNADGNKDVVVTNLGMRGRNNSSFSLMTGSDNGTLTVLPQNLDSEGNMFAIETGDFNEDGIEDLVIGYFDCRVVFYEGQNDGSYERRTVREFVYESRAMVSGDFDQDGDLDLAGVGAKGDIVVLTNNGDFMTESSGERAIYETGERTAKVPNLWIVDQNEDGDPDLLTVARHSIILLTGGAGTTFTRVADTDVALQIVADDAVRDDFDGDGRADLMLSCLVQSCVSLYHGTEAGFEFGVTLNVPDASYLATGDLDGDGLADIVGSGSSLWAALSTPPPSGGTKQVTNAEPREVATQPVINEIIASNRNLVVEGFENTTPDLVEIFFGGEGELDLGGWMMRLETPEEVLEFTMSAGTTIMGGEQMLVIFDEVRVFNGIPSAGFKLPREGATLSLINGGEVVDEVTYPELPVDTSYSRYTDGFTSFTLNNFPDPGLANQDNGTVDPNMKFRGLRYDLTGDSPRLMVTATATDDVGVFTLTMNYRRLDGAVNETGNVILVDDGRSGDGRMADGFFAADVTDLFPPGAEIEFFFTVVDLMGAQKSKPGTSYFAPLGQTTEHLKIRISEAEEISQLQISEVVSKNKTGLREENGKTVDWVEIRNTGAANISLDGVALGQEQFDDEAFRFPEGMALEPGEYVIVFADGDPEDGPLHAPFRVSSAGDSLALVTQDENGVEELLDVVTVPPLEVDTSWARLGRTNEIFIGHPTPGAFNGPDQLTMLRRGNSFWVVFPTKSGKDCLLQESRTLLPNSWITVEELVGDGIEHVYRGDFQSRNFYRLEEQAEQPGGAE